jgi:hypothetical protein
MSSLARACRDSTLTATTPIAISGKLGAQHSADPGICVGAGGAEDRSVGEYR